MHALYISLDRDEIDGQRLSLEVWTITGILPVSKALHDIRRILNVVQ